MIKEYLKNNLLLSDGAMGTYYSYITGDSTTRVELSNINKPEVVLNIHKEYINSGSKLIRTNTFAANSFSLDISKNKLKEIILSGWNIAKESVGDKNIFIAGDIGPIPQIDKDGVNITNNEIINEYKYIVDCFLSIGCKIFNLETFSTTDYIDEVTNYIKSRDKESFIMVQFAIKKNGYSRKGLSSKELYDSVNKKNIDLLGLNCGSGPTHLIKHVDKFQTIYANAGYPEIINNRTVFNSDPKYYANIIKSILDKGLKIIGGCCGTTPEHIKALNQIINGTLSDITIPKKYIEVTPTVSTINRNILIAVELDPPSKPDITKLLDSAKIMKNLGANFITIADSPSGRMRLNSMTIASRIKRDIKIDVIPHICCRDRNMIALKSDILAAYTEGIRDILIITGDPIPLEERDEVRKVFNCNSISLMKEVNQFNKTILKDSQFNIGGALNLGAKNLEGQEKRMLTKVEFGAKRFLTQPIYEQRSIDFLLKMKKPKDVEVLAGILPVVTYKNAMFLNNEFPGITIPDNIIARFDPKMSREEAENVGIDISVDIVNRLKDGVDGFYFMTPFNRTGMIREIINRAGLR